MPASIPRVHPIGCSCTVCRPDQSSRRIWLAVSILTFGGTLAMAVDLSSLTPTLARLLGIMS